MTFAEAVEALGRLGKRGWRLELDRMRELVRRLDLDHTPRYVHVAGTNGKGSVTAFVQSLLVEQGYRTGATYSPYVFSIRERVQLGRNLISESDFARWVGRVLAVGDELEGTELGGPTEFEVKTAVGFGYWSEQRCDAVALEVGLGGRLDATNVVTDPAACVIVSIGLDHTAILGETLGKIAAEKAGIVKPGRPVVVGEVHPEAWESIHFAASVRGAPVWRFGRDVHLGPGLDGWTVETPNGVYGGLNPGIRGAMQPHNMALAVAALDAGGLLRDPTALARGVSRARLPGRFQTVHHSGQRYLLDGAHNAESAEHLVASLPLLPDWPVPTVLLTGMVEGHDPRRFYTPLAPVVQEVHIVPIASERSRSPLTLALSMGDLFPAVTAHETLEAGLAAARSREGALILVTGSFYLLGDVAPHLGLDA